MIDHGSPDCGVDDNEVFYKPYYYMYWKGCSEHWTLIGLGKAAELTLVTMLKC
jgi:hypothetical protein